LTGGRRAIHQKKRKFELARPSAMTKLGSKRVAEVRGRGGGLKYRALRLDVGNFSWGTEHCTRKARILDVVYNASNNELVRTKTLVKNAVIQIDAAPFRMFYEQHYGQQLTKKKQQEKTEAAAASSASGATAAEKKAEVSQSAADNKKQSKKIQKKLKQRNTNHVLDQHLRDQFNGGRLLACVSSRPGQCGRCDGYILEGKELEFYQRKLVKRR